MSGLYFVSLQKAKLNDFLGERVSSAFFTISPEANTTSLPALIFR